MGNSGSFCASSAGKKAINRFSGMVVAAQQFQVPCGKDVLRFDYGFDPGKAIFFVVAVFPSHAGQCGISTAL